MVEECIPAAVNRRTCWILRGLPGVGKTAVARQLFRMLNPVTYVSLDEIRDNKGYVNDWEKIKENMEADVELMKYEFNHALEAGDHIILDNTHSRIWEYEWAEILAKEHDYMVLVIEVQAPLLDCWRRTTHAIPWNKFMEMYDRWELPRAKDFRKLMGIIAGVIKGK